MGNDLRSHKPPAEMDPDAVFAALDKVVAETPLATRRRAGGAMAEPTVDAEGAPQAAANRQPEREIAGEPSETVSPERAPALTPNPVPTVASPKPSTDNLAAEPAAVPLAPPVPAPVTRASMQQPAPSTVPRNTARDAEVPVQGPAIIPAATRHRSVIGVVLVLVIVIAAVEAVFLVQNRRQ